MASEYERLAETEDPFDAIKGLSALISRGEERLSLARSERMRRLAEAKQNGATWRALSDICGMSETYLRREVPSHMKQPEQTVEA